VHSFDYRAWCARQLLLELDQSVQQLSRKVGNGHASVLKLNGVYNNLMRQWADI
jgi:PKHD-type hydroxylase